MSCCCAPEVKKTSTNRGKLEFAKVHSSGFEKERKTIHYADEVDGEKSACRNVRSDSSILSDFDDQHDSDEEIGDMVFVDGNEADLEECDDEDTLMERVWWLARPPYVPRQTPVVSARRIQVVKERLSSTIKGLPTIRAALKEQVARSLQSRRGSKSRDYIAVGKFSGNSRAACGTDEVTSIPVCARKLSDLL
ncbi:uncharacterized protein LOC124300544 [Neodiprion virginianus]|uniref:uncharacterized protein LOC124300544 n=1 Tax=Neodiprion virginianus TaxID=2961670 RepID=UPI001EE7733B|nr:uncharacterized protein LOC124300544 [Neodiprion virginianus]